MNYDIYKICIGTFAVVMLVGQLSLGIKILSDIRDQNANSNYGRVDTEEMENGDICYVLEKGYGAPVGISCVRPGGVQPAQ